MSLLKKIFIILIIVSMTGCSSTSKSTEQVYEEAQTKVEYYKKKYEPIYNEERNKRELVIPTIPTEQVPYSSHTEMVELSKAEEILMYILIIDETLENTPRDELTEGLFRKYFNSIETIENRK